MDSMKRKHGRTDLPGPFYQRRGRWWWKVQLPGWKKPQAFPLKAYGAKFATGDFQVAREVTRNLYQQSIFKSDQSISIDRITNLDELFKAYLEYAKTYYRDPDGTVTSEPQNIAYAMKSVIKHYGGLSIEEFGPLSGGCYNMVNMCNGADLDGSNFIDLGDVAVLSLHWLENQ